MDKLRKRLVVTWAEFQQSVVERNIPSVRWNVMNFTRQCGNIFQGWWVKGQQFVFFWDNVNNMKYEWITLLKNDFLDFPRYSGYTIQARWATVEANDAKFPWDLTHQKSLKSVNLWQSYLKNKRGTFLRHSLCFLVPSFMVVVCNRADHYIFILWFLLLSIFFFLA